MLVVLRGRAGSIVLMQFRDSNGELAWMRGTGEKPMDECAIDHYVNQQVGYDPDLWVVEFEAPDFLPPFEGRIV